MQYLKSVLKGVCGTKINHTLIHSYLKTIHEGCRELPEAKYHHFGCFYAAIKYKLDKLNADTRQESEWDFLKLCLGVSHFL